MDSQPERLLSFYNCHDLLAKVLCNGPCLHISLFVSMTSHFSIFPPSSLFLITLSPIVHLADSTFSTRTPSFCFCDHLFSSFLTHWNKRRCQNASKEMAQCTRCATPPPPLGWNVGWQGASSLDKGPRKPWSGGTGVHWTLETVDCGFTQWWGDTVYTVLLSKPKVTKGQLYCLSAFDTFLYMIQGITKNYLNPKTGMV